MHNLSTVIRFEITRALKKKSFWILAICFPLIFAAMFGVIYFSNKATDDAEAKLKNQEFSIVVTDQSGLIEPAFLTSLNAKSVPLSEKQQTIDKVQSGKLDAYIIYPTDVAKQSIEIYGKDVGLFDNGRYDSIAKELLSISVESDVSPTIQSVIKGSVNTTSTVYKDGKIHDSTQEMIAPGIFLVLFYFLISFFGGQMLTSTTEEKENRVIEMILTTIEARTLIIGKIISLIVLAIIQGLLILAPAIIGYLLFHNQLKLPSLDISHLVFDPARISLGFIIFALSFLMFTGLLVAIGAAVPTAKEANSFFGVVMILIFGPLYALSLFISSPDTPISTFLTLFPLTSPIPLMVRNAVGNLDFSEAALGIAILGITAIIILVVAVRIFRFGVLEYSRKLSLREIFRSY